MSQTPSPPLQSAPITIPPGQRITVRVAVDPSHLSPGLADKFVWVYIKGQDAPAATLEMTGTILASAAFAPALVDFGRVPAGGQATRTVTVTLDRRLAEAQAPPRLVSTNPHVLIRPLPPAPVPGPAGTTVVVRTYRVSLRPDTPLGLVNGLLSLTSPDPATAQAVNGVAASLAGVVVGDLSASPQTVAFGMVTRGQPGTQRVALSSTPAARFRILSNSPFIFARLTPAPRGSTAASPDGLIPTATLVVSLQPRVPPGVLQTQVTVMVGDGERLVLPVYGYVVQPQGSGPGVGR